MLRNFGIISRPYAIGSKGPVTMSFDKGSSEVSAHELLVLENKRLTEEVKNLKQLVTDLYIAIATGKTSPPMQTNLLGAASFSAHQARGSPTKFEDPQYSPDFPHYQNDTSDGGSSKIHLWAPHPSQMGHTSPRASVPPFTGPIRRENLGRKDERERGPGRRDEEWCKQPHSYPRASQKHHLQHYPLGNSKYCVPPLQKVRPYAPKTAYPQWRAPAPQPTYPTHQAPHNHFQAPSNLPYRPEGPPVFCPSAYHQKLRKEERNRFTLIGESYSSLFQKLKDLNMLKPIAGNVLPMAKVDHTRQCAYHSNMPGHDTDDCRSLKKAIQAMIDNGQIQVEGADLPNINQNSLPIHDDVYMVGMVCGEDLRAESAMPIVPVGDVSVRANQTVVTVNCVPEIELGIADRVRGGEMKKMNISLVKPIPNLTRSFISPKEVKSTLMGLGENKEKRKKLPDSSASL